MDSLQRYLNLKPTPPTSEIQYSLSNQDLGKGIKQKQKSHLMKELSFNETDDTDGPSDWDSCSTSLKSESYIKCKGLNLDGNHPCQLLSETKISSGSTLFGKSPFQEDETVGAGRDSEIDFRFVIRGEKSVPQKEDEAHLSVRKLKVKEDGSTISCREKDSYRRPKDITENLNHPFQSLPVTKSLSGSTLSRMSPFQSKEGARAGSGPENAYRAVIPQIKPVPQKYGERQLPQKTEGQSTERCK